jgi:hypothetical protein
MRRDIQDLKRRVVMLRQVNPQDIITSKDVSNRLVLHTDKYKDEVLVDRMLHEKVDEFVSDVKMKKVFTNLTNALVNTYTQKALRKPDRYQHYLIVRGFNQTYLASWLMRLCNIHVKPIMVVRTSFDFRFHNIPASVWHIFSSMRLVLSITETGRLYDIANQIPIYIRMKWPMHDTVAIGGGDNISYYNGTVLIISEGTGTQIFAPGRDQTRPGRVRVRTSAYLRIVMRKLRDFFIINSFLSNITLTNMDI